MQSASPVVIVACGAAKLDHAARAEELYTGPYFRACLDYALSIAKRDNVFILSAKHGLLRLHTKIEPYNTRLLPKDPNRIGWRAVCHQAFELGIRRCIHGKLVKRPIFVLGGRDYVELARCVWPHIEAPLAGKGGLGQQISWLKRATKENI